MLLCADLSCKQPMNLTHPGNRATNKQFPSQEANNDKENINKDLFYFDAV